MLDRLLALIDFLTWVGAPLDPVRDSLDATVELLRATLARRLAAMVAPHLVPPRPSVEQVYAVARAFRQCDEDGHLLDATGVRAKLFCADAQRAVLCRANREQMELLARALAAAWGVALPASREAWGEPDERDAGATS